MTATPRSTAPEAAVSDPGARVRLNADIACVLRELAALLAAQHADPARVLSFRRAATVVEGLPRSVSEIGDAAGLRGLEAHTRLGGTIVATIDEILRTGRCRELDRLRGSLGPEQVFQTLPGVGPTLARRLHEVLHADTLEELEIAAHDGRLEAVSGVGARRAAALRGALTEALSRVKGRRAEDPDAPEPSVEVLLDVDREYRGRARAGTLPRIAPRRFNPTGTACLPILHAVRGPWHLTALFSNTARAHELGKTREWVIVYFYDGEHQERQHTVVTETRGTLTGRRVVRGREADCLALYEPDTARLAAAMAEPEEGESCARRPRTDVNAVPSEPPGIRAP